MVKCIKKVFSSECYHKVEIISYFNEYLGEIMKKIQKIAEESNLLENTIRQEKLFENKIENC